MLQERIVWSELHCLRVNEHELQLGRMLRIQKRRNDHIKADRLTLLCSTCHKKVRSVCKIEHLDLLRKSRISYGNRKLRRAVSERIVVEHRLQRNNRRCAVRHLDSYTAWKRHNSYATHFEGHSDLSMDAFDRSHLHSRSKHDLIQRHGRANHCGNLLYIDLIVLKRRTDHHVVLIQFRLTDGMLLASVIMKKVKRRELILTELLTVVDSRKILQNRNYDLLPDHFHIICRSFGLCRDYRFSRNFRLNRSHIDFLVLLFKLLIYHIIFLRNFLLGILGIILLFVFQIIF